MSKNKSRCPSGEIRADVQGKVRGIRPEIRSEVSGVRPHSHDVYASC